MRTANALRWGVIFAALCVLSYSAAYGADDVTVPASVDWMSYLGPGTAPVIAGLSLIYMIVKEVRAALNEFAKALHDCQPTIKLVHEYECVKCKEKSETPEGERATP